MKIIQEAEKFRPVTITLETSEEYEIIIAALDRYLAPAKTDYPSRHHTKANSMLKQFAREVYIRVECSG